MNNNFTNKETNKMIKKIIASISAVAMSFCAFSSIVLADSYSVGIKSGVTKTETAGDYGEQYFIIDCADIANKSAFLNCQHFAQKLEPPNLKIVYLHRQFWFLLLIMTTVPEQQFFFCKNSRFTLLFCVYIHYIYSRYSHKFHNFTL